MTDKQIDEIIVKEDPLADRWGTPCYTTEQVRRIAYGVNVKMQERLNKQIVENAQKDAKIYAYEAIIANSNFKAVMLKEGKNKCQKPSS
jgi:hypothetical protein